jgi:hypothetical protein
MIPRALIHEAALEKMKVGGVVCCKRVPEEPHITISFGNKSDGGHTDMSPFDKPVIRPKIMSIYRAPSKPAVMLWCWSIKTHLGWKEFSNNKEVS